MVAVKAYGRRNRFGFPTKACCSRLIWLASVILIVIPLYLCINISLFPDNECYVTVHDTQNTLRKRVTVRAKPGTRSMNANYFWLEYQPISSQTSRFATLPSEKDPTTMNEHQDFNLLRLRANTLYKVEALYSYSDPSDTVTDNLQKPLVAKCGAAWFTTGALPQFLSESNITLLRQSGDGSFSLAMHTYHFIWRKKSPKTDLLNDNAMYAFDSEGHIVWYIDKNELPPEIRNNFRFYDAVPRGKGSYNWIVQGYSKLLEITPFGEVVRVSEHPTLEAEFISRFHHDVTVRGDGNSAIALSFGLMHADRPLCPREKLPGAELIPHTITKFLVWDFATNGISYLANETELQGLDFYRDRTFRSCGMYMVSQMSRLSCDGMPPVGVCQPLRDIKMNFTSMDFGHYTEPFDSQDWAHSNSVIVPEAGDDKNKLLISFRHLNSVVLVSSDMKQTFWRIGSIPGSSLKFENSSDRFYGQHSPFLTKDGDLLLFDNGKGRPEEEGGLYSRVVKYQLDWDARIVRKLWDFNPGREYYSECCSSVKRLPNGNWWVLFGSQPDNKGSSHLYCELTPKGKEVSCYSYYNPRLRATYKSWPIQSINGERRVN